ncbi:hypothetical protein [uncultured Draconibacterium sp.]|uniref:hypothetical protein n=1 Tax=uncultured Draconibacterium sp. TaxID=1573823 RepID=UPI00321772AD
MSINTKAPPRPGYGPKSGTRGAPEARFSIQNKFRYVVKTSALNSGNQAVMPEACLEVGSHSVQLVTLSSPAE